MHADTACMHICMHAWRCLYTREAPEACEHSALLWGCAALGCIGSYQCMRPKTQQQLLVQPELPLLLLSTAAAVAPAAAAAAAAAAFYCSSSSSCCCCCMQY